VKKLKAERKLRNQNVPVQGGRSLNKKKRAEKCKRIRGHKVQKGSEQGDIFLVI